MTGAGWQFVGNDGVVAGRVVRRPWHSRIGYRHGGRADEGPTEAVPNGLCSWGGLSDTFKGALTSNCCLYSPFAVD